MNTTSSPWSYPHQRHARRLTILALLLFVVPLFAVIAVPSPRVAQAAMATTTSDLNLRTGPSTDFPVLTVMPSGAEVSIDGAAQSGFYPVSYRGTSGFASATYLTTGGGSSGGGATVTSSLNLRAGPSTSDRVLAVMSAGAGVTLTGDSANGFLSVNYQGTSGWAFATYLDTGGGGGGGGETATVSSSLNLRAGPSTADRIILTMPTGASVTLSGESSNGWLGVTYNGTAGWAFGAYIGSGGGGGGVTDTAWTTSSLNLRAGPSTGTSVLTVMPSGAMLTTTGASQGGFYPVTYSGRSGWASATYLSFSGPPATPPPPAPSGDIISIIYAAADRYGQNREDMLRVARCESNLIPTAYNRSSGASGLFQFLPGTWATTIYADYDIFDPWASANAAAWMWSVGRRNEWVCQ